jgi:K+-transporting ATPase ATPase C chain
MRHKPGAPATGIPDRRSRSGLVETLSVEGDFMNAHIRANLWLLGVTVLLCCVLYPLSLWAIGQVVCPEQASGSLIVEDGKAIGSKLIAQPFTGDEYFWPRPSAVSYNASGSGGSNYGANNPRLRARVAQALGPIVKYAKTNQLVGKDIESWFQQDRFQGKPHIVAQWAEKFPFAAQDWVKADALNGEYVREWQTAHADEVEAWKKDNPDNTDPKPEDLAVPFFVSFSKTFPGKWPGTVEEKDKKRIQPVQEDTAIQANFFDMWLQEHPDVELARVPADMVMASGSGLDPDITLKNALYQLDRVADAWAKKTGRGSQEVRKTIENLLHAKASAPLPGLAGVEMVNVLEVNLALRDLFPQIREKGR